MRHYLQIKDQYKDCVLFYRLGDFYEMFFDDAKEVSALLDLTLTGRDCGLEERAPMCGIPFHAADTYIARLVALGKRSPSASNSPILPRVKAWWTETWCASFRRVRSSKTNF